MKSGFAITVAALALFGASAANAAIIYDAKTGFSSTNGGTSVWSYGVGNVQSGSFTALPTYGAAFHGNSDLQYWQGLPESSDVPIVLNNSTSAGINIGTPYVPADALLIHPGSDTDYPGDADVIVRFTAATAGNYSYAGFFELLDNNPSGVNVAVFSDVAGNVIPQFGDLLLSPPANSTSQPYTPGDKATFGSSIYLGAGDSLSFSVNNDADYLYDSTGFDVTITAVPEPAAWTMMILGFGLVGFSLRRRKSVFA